MRRMSVILFVAAGLAGAGLASFLALSVGEHGGGANAAPITPRSTPVLPVPTVAVVKKTVPLYLDYVGMTEPLRTVTLQAKVTGYLAVQAAGDGADVKTSDLIYRIDPRDYQAALDQAKAQVQRDQAALEYARANNHRNSVLVKAGWVTKDAFDQSTSTLRQAEGAGRLVIVLDASDRENEGDFVGAAESITSEQVDFMLTHGIVGQVVVEEAEFCTYTLKKQQLLVENIASFFGNSGGGVFNDSGQLVAVHFAGNYAAFGCNDRYQGHAILWGYGVGPDAIREFLGAIHD